MKRKAKHKQFCSDSKEADLLSSFEKGEWKTSANSKKEKALAKDNAATALGSMNIRIVKPSETVRRPLINLSMKYLYSVIGLSCLAATCTIVPG